MLIIIHILSFYVPLLLSVLQYVHFKCVTFVTQLVFCDCAVWNNMLVGWLCWGLTSQSTIFQSCRDGAIASWVINQYFRGVKCLAQGHNTAAVGLEPRTSRSGVRHSTTEPPRSPWNNMIMQSVQQGLRQNEWVQLHLENPVASLRQQSHFTALPRGKAIKLSPFA